jgi:cell division protein FtsI (penicillin-binding protein 3)
MKFKVFADGSEKSAAETARFRLMIGGALFAAAFVAISGRLVDLAIINQGATGPQLASRFVITPATMARADILDRNGALLATNLETSSLYAKPQLVTNPSEAADAIVSAIPDLDRDGVAAKLSSDAPFVYLKRGLTPNEVYRANRLGIPGLEFESEQRRIYPSGVLAAHATGYSGIDANGLAGIEQSMNTRLSTESEPLALSVDIRIQQIMRQELTAQIEKFGAIGGGGLVLDVHTGEILALVSLPDFDPNAPGTASEDQRFNRISYGVYELGSVFKLFTLATALETGAADLGSQYDATHPIRISRFTIRDYKPEARVLTFQEVLRYSSNIGAAKIAMDTGRDAQRRFLTDLGFLSKTDIELPERGSPLFPEPWRDVNTMTIGFGHGIAVTPLHLASAVAALVNGGEYHPPTILRRSPGDEIASRRIYSIATSVQMRGLMRMVVAEGTGGNAEAPGYLVGGKTGTAEKNINGRYNRGSLLTTFVAAFPITEPKYVVLAMLDEPHGIPESYGYATAGWTAAPVISRVISRMAPLLDILPSDHLVPDSDGSAAMPAALFLRNAVQHSAAN